MVFLNKSKTKIFLTILVIMVITSCSPNIPLFGCIEGDCVEGKGTWLEANGNKYIGTFKNGYRYGNGTLLYPDGEKWEGSWKKIKNGMVKVF